jgi:hypothetical protein
MGRWDGEFTFLVHERLIAQGPAAHSIQHAWSPHVPYEHGNEVSSAFD